MLTATVRDLHLAHPRRFLVSVDTTAPEIWWNNPNVVDPKMHNSNLRTLDMHYPLVHQSHRPYHFIHGFAQYLEQQLQVRIPITHFGGDIHLSQQERLPLDRIGKCSVPKQYWLLVAGGKYDYTTKWWNPQNYQQVVDHFAGTIQFVQCGLADDWHPPLRGTINLVGETSIRALIRLMHHAMGVLCPVTFAMHLAAAVPTVTGRPRIRPCVVIAGAREPAHWEAYPHHQFISNHGSLDCCRDGACWRSRCQLVGDGDRKDRHNVCEHPVDVADDLRVPKCMDIITPAEVIRRIELLRHPTSAARERDQPLTTKA